MSVTRIYKRIACVGIFIIFLAASFIARGQAETTLSTYSGEAEITAATTVRLLPGFATGPSATLRIYITPNAAGCPILTSAPSSNRNYVLTNTMRQPGITGTAGKTVCQVNQTIQYIDGLGRPLQTVQVQGSPTQKDVIQPVSYD
ncbi:DUF6443 domain-containing protein, partial [Hufsiella ginkgonis]